MKTGLALAAAALAAAVSTAAPAPAAPAAPAAAAPGVAPEPGRHLMDLLGPQFSIFLAPVQEDLKLSPEQKQHLNQMLAGASQGVGQFMQSIAGAPPEAREEKLQEFRQHANRAVGAALADLLKPEQHKRLQQIVLQQEGLFALGNPALAGELKLTDDQKAKLAALFQETQRRFEALQEKVRKGGKPEEAGPEAAKTRKEQEAKIEALLTEPQRAQWKTMLGKPLAL